jgi:hypothetical protein
MTTSLQKVSAGLLGGIALLALSGIDARADGAVGVTATCPATGPGIVVCGTVGVLLHEIVQIANGKDGFGPNGEIMKVLAAPVKIVDGNVRAAAHERGEIAKVLRATTGISVEDIRKYGVFGGPNSIFRKPFG